MAIISKPYTENGRKEHDRIFKKSALELPALALAKMGQCGISAAEAGKNLRKSVRSLRKKHKKRE